ARLALDLEHHLALELAQPLVRQVEGDGDAGHAVGAEPLVRQPEMRAEVEAAGLELAIEPPDVGRERRAFDAQRQVRDAHVEQALGRPLDPFAREAPRRARGAARLDPPDAADRPLRGAASAGAAPRARAPPGAAPPRGARLAGARPFGRAALLLGA